ncbi:MAG: hypothetical protein A2287_04730 [Candidatus Melainabacteria bacterium RIFOXYA12_FULL_32_12]|nr:MAG: hypothetical protein A2287_04730 [Candidatus Melainabacteria bacterium RIFOXYA12_FULL_32_12]
MEKVADIAKQIHKSNPIPLLTNTTYETMLSINPVCPVCKERPTQYLDTFAGNKIALPCAECDKAMKDDEKLKKEREEKQKLIAKRQRILSFSNLGTKYKDSNFVDFDHNKEGLNNCTIWAKRFKNRIINGGEKISLYMYGITGNGKTELQACAYNELEKDGFNCLFTTLGKIFGKMHDYQNVKDIEVYDIIRNLDAFFIDDFGVEALDKKKQRMAF